MLKRFWTCWFCKKRQDEVRILVAGPENICICDECIEVCNTILKENMPEIKESANEKI